MDNIIIIKYLQIFQISLIILLFNSIVIFESNTKQKQMSYNDYIVG